MSSLEAKIGNVLAFTGGSRDEIHKALQECAYDEGDAVLRIMGEDDTDGALAAGNLLPAPAPPGGALAAAAVGH